MVYQLIGGGAGGGPIGGPSGDVASVVVDALPYIDHEYEGPGVREAVSIYLIFLIIQQSPFR